jgi:hypothetical protein
MNVNWHLHFFWNVISIACICLVIRVTSICKVSIDVWFFLHKSHYMPKCKLCASIDVHFILCEFLRVKYQKLAKTLLKIHIGSHEWLCAGRQMVVMVVKIWVNQSIHQFLVGCLNPCLQGTSVRVGLPSVTQQLTCVHEWTMQIYHYDIFVNTLVTTLWVECTGTP